MTRITLFAILTAMLLGCGTRDTANISPQNSDASAAPAELAIVRKTVSELLNVSESELRNDVPLTELNPPMDELDLVELVMELEDHYSISIPDAALVGEASNDGVNELPKQLNLKFNRSNRSACPEWKIIVVAEFAKAI